MKTFVGVVVALSLLFAVPVMAFDLNQDDVVLEKKGSHGPASNSGDGIHDKSGNEAPFGSRHGK